MKKLTLLIALLGLFLLSCEKEVVMPDEQAPPLPGVIFHAEKLLGKYSGTWIKKYESYVWDALEGDSYSTYTENGERTIEVKRKNGYLDVVQLFPANLIGYFGDDYPRLNEVKLDTIFPTFNGVFSPIWSHHYKTDIYFKGVELDTLIIKTTNTYKSSMGEDHHESECETTDYLLTKH